MAQRNLEDYSRRARTLKFGTNVIAGTLLLLVIIAAANYISYKRPVQLDLTRDKQYTVSDATARLLNNLKDQVIVTVYASRKEIPTDWKRQLQELETLLKQYRNLSDRKLRYSILNPSADPDVEKKAREAGIREQQMQQVDVKEASFAIGYLGFTVEYKGKVETIGVIRPDSPLEYQLTRAINKVAEADIPAVAVLAPQGNPFMGEPSPFSVLPQLLQQEGYTVKSLEPGNLDELTSETDLLMVFEPDDLSEEALFRIDQYVMNGGSLFVAAGGVQIQSDRGPTPRATAKAPNINSILEHYGVRINADLVEDWAQGSEQNLLTQRGIVRTVNPFLIEVKLLSETSPITAKLPGVAMVYPSSVSPSAQATSGTYTALAESSPRSKHQTEFFVVEPFRVKRPTDADTLQSFDLIAQVKGQLTSRFATVDPPALTNDDGTTRAVAASEVKTRGSRESQIIVAGSGLSFMDQILQQGSPLNGLFLLNVADAVTRGGEFIALRGKQQSISFLRGDFSQREAIVAQILVLTVMPLLVVALGIIMYYLNRRRRARYRATYGATRQPAPPAPAQV